MRVIAYAVTGERFSLPHVELVWQPWQGWLSSAEAHYFCGKESKVHRRPLRPTAPCCNQPIVLHPSMSTSKATRWSVVDLVQIDPRTLSGPHCRTNPSN